MLNRYFNPKRFARLYRHDMMMNYKMYGMFTLAISIVIFCVLCIGMSQMYYRFDMSEYIPPLCMSIIFGGILSVTTAFPMTKNKEALTGYLMQPASMFEKFMVQFINRIILFFPLLLIIFWLDAHLAKGIISMFEFKREVAISSFSFKDIWELREFVRDREEALWFIVGMFSTIVSFAFMCSTIFNRYKLFKTLILFGVIVLAMMCYSVILSHIFLPGRTSGFEVEMVFYQLYEDMWNIEFFVTLFACCSSFFLLPMAFYKLKEKQV